MFALFFVSSEKKEKKKGEIGRQRRVSNRRGGREGWVAIELLKPRGKAGTEIIEKGFTGILRDIAEGVGFIPVNDVQRRGEGPGGDQEAAKQRGLLGAELTAIRKHGGQQQVL